MKVEASVPFPVKGGIGMKKALAVLSGLLLAAGVSAFPVSAACEVMELAAVDEVTVSVYTITEYNAVTKYDPVLTMTLKAGETRVIPHARQSPASLPFRVEAGDGVDAEKVEDAIAEQIAPRNLQGEMAFTATCWGPPVDSGYTVRAFYEADAYDRIEIHTDEVRTYRVYRLVDGEKVYHRSESRAERHTYEGMMPKRIEYSVDLK